MLYYIETNKKTTNRNGQLTESRNTLLFELEELYKEERNNTSFPIPTVAYRIDLRDVSLSLEKEMKKASDFFRRTVYRYDWLIPVVDEKGEIMGIDNPEEMQEQWKELRSVILGDYEGTLVDEKISQIDHAMREKDFYIEPLSNYSYFGLAFPRVPIDAGAQWHKEREITLSDFDDIKFIEHLVCENTDKNNRFLSFTGKVINSDKCILNKFYGRMLMPCNDIFPTQAWVEINYTQEDKATEWRFELFSV